MEINSQSIDAYRKILIDPKTHGLPIRPLSECFELADKPTPKHILFKDYQQEVGDNLPKIFFYLVMDEIYPIGKADDGNLGYFVKYKAAHPEIIGELLTEPEL